MVNSLEALLMQSNPVLDPEELRLPAAEADTRCASILERRAAMQTQTPTGIPMREPTPPPRRWKKSALAFGIGLMAVLIATVAAVMLVGTSDQGPADQPTTTMTTTTTGVQETTTSVDSSIAGPLDGIITAPPYADVPSFSGVVRYYEHDPTTGEPGRQVTVMVRHAGPLSYNIEVLAESGEPPMVGGPGMVFFGDGTENWIDHPSDPAPLSQGDVQAFWHLFYGSVPLEGSGLPGWAGICAETGTELGVETIAGRQATRIGCSTDLEDYELSLDEETGVVMQMAGPLDFPVLARDGFFTFAEITYEPVTPNNPETPDPDPRAYPPFHLIREITMGSETMTLEIWYQDAETIRNEITDAGRSDIISSYSLVANGYAGGCDTSEGGYGCSWDPLGEIDDAYFAQLIGQIPMGERTLRCTELDETTVLARPARHFACGDGIVTHDYWYDRETELLVEEAGSFETLQTTFLEVNPVFPEGVFEYREIVPPKPDDSLDVGDIAPLWSGPLVGGGSFDLAGQRGSPVVVFNWFPLCGDACFDGLDLMQQLYEKYGSEVAFVTVSEAIESETARALERGGNTVPAVYCVAGSGQDIDPACTTPQPGVDPWLASPWFLWGNSIPTTTVLDADGTAVAIYSGLITYGDDLAALLGRMSGATP